MKYIILAAVLAAVITALIIFDNKRLKISRYTAASSRLPAEFDGFKIVQLSDIHGAVFGKENARLLGKISTEKPEIIVITGDIIDSRKPNIPAAEKLVKNLRKIAPVYFVSGNHEARFTEWPTLKEKLEKNGAEVIDNSKKHLCRGDAKIALFGLRDPQFITNYQLKNSIKAAEEFISEFDKKEGEYSILLSHRPEIFETYVKHGFDVVFSGHVHGGQFRLPLLGGLYVPIQGLFPKYDAGLFEKNETKMIVSRGIGQSIIPVRLGNPPDIVVTKLTKVDL
ncbi:MAG: metallophosphoesterase [Clostridia bacterium]|nr:metallophosphoesterase [Clostridia bacterium]